MKLDALYIQWFKLTVKCDYVSDKACAAWESEQADICRSFEAEAAALHQQAEAVRAQMPDAFMTAVRDLAMNDLRQTNMDDVERRFCIASTKVASRWDKRERKQLVRQQRAQRNYAHDLETLAEMHRMADAQNEANAANILDLRSMDDYAREHGYYEF